MSSEVLQTESSNINAEMGYDQLMNAIQMPLINPNKNQDNKFDLEEAKTEEAAYLDQ